jgi:archaellum component FlaC
MLFRFRQSLKEDVESLQTEFRDLNELVYRLSNKVDNLFKRDKHGTLRPKVDLLDERIEKLEKTEVDDLSEKTER